MSEALAVDEMPGTIALLEAGIDALVEAPHVTASDEALLDSWVALERLRCKLAAAENALIAEIDARGIAQARGIKSTAVLGRALLRVAPVDMAARVAAARQLGARRTLTGEPIHAAYAQIAAALRAGAISARHASVATAMIDRLPDEVREELHDTVEAQLVTVAREHDPMVLSRFAQDLGQALDPDGRLADERFRERARGLELRVRPDGSARLEGELTAECTEFVRTVLEPLTKPAAEIEGIKDPRTPGQRRHDALLAVCKAAMRAGAVPGNTGVTTTVLLTATKQEWEAGTGWATTAHGVRVPMASAHRWVGGDARMMRIGVTANGAVDDWTDARRLFTESQRLAIIARDGACSFPDCDAPPGFCEIHHVEEHNRGGPTTVANGALLCGWNHRHSLEAGWTCVMIDGRPRGSHRRGSFPTELRVATPCIVRQCRVPAMRDDTHPAPA